MSASPADPLRPLNAAGPTRKAAYRVWLMLAELQEAVEDCNEAALSSPAVDGWRRGPDFVGVPRDLLRATDEDLLTAVLEARARRWDRARASLDRIADRWS